MVPRFSGGFFHDQPESYCMDDLGLPAVGMMSAYLHSHGVLPIMCMLAAVAAMEDSARLRQLYWGR